MGNPCHRWPTIDVGADRAPQAGPESRSTCACPSVPAHRFLFSSLPPASISAASKDESRRACARSRHQRSARLAAGASPGTRRHGHEGDRPALRRRRDCRVSSILDTRAGTSFADAATAQQARQVRAAVVYWMSSLADEPPKALLAAAASPTLSALQAYAATTTGQAMANACSLVSPATLVTHWQWRTDAYDEFGRRVP